MSRRRTVARSLALAALLLSAAAWSREAASPAGSKFAAAERAHYAARCRARKDLDSCSDAVRWNPGDPALVVALADAQARAKRLADALRNYRRAAVLAPTLNGLDAKIAAAETKLSARKQQRPSRAHVTTVSGTTVPGATVSGAMASGKRYSNAASLAQSH